MGNCICTAFYHTEGASPNVKNSKNINTKFATYYTCMVVMFASARSFFGGRLIVFTNKNIPIKYLVYLEYLKVEVIILSPNECLYADKYNNKFPGCLFSLDVIDFLAKKAELLRLEKILLIDSDCIFRGSVDFSADCEALHLKFSTSRVVNGQSISNLEDLYMLAYDKRLQGNFNFYGGEYYLFSSKAVSAVSKLISMLCNKIDSTEKWQSQNFTEEHIISIVLNNYGCAEAGVNNRTARIWTARSFNNVEESNINSNIYHLPAEKARFFQEVFKLITVNKKIVSEIDFKEMSFKHVTTIAKPIIVYKAYIYVRERIKSKMLIFVKKK